MSSPGLWLVLRCYFWSCGAQVVQSLTRTGDAGPVNSYRRVRVVHCARIALVASTAPSKTRSIVCRAAPGASATGLHARIVARAPGASISHQREELRAARPSAAPRVRSRSCGPASEQDASHAPEAASALQQRLPQQANSAAAARCAPLASTRTSRAAWRARRARPVALERSWTFPIPPRLAAAAPRAGHFGH